MANAPPSWIDRINFVVDYWSNPCDNPLVVYYETFKPALFKTILTWLAWDMQDVVRGFFRPKGLRSARHGRRTRRGKERLVWPEVGEMIGGNLPGAEKVQGRQITQGVKNLWIIDGWIQRIGYKLMVISTITEALYDWTSAIYINNPIGCQNRVAALRGPNDFGTHLPLRFTPTLMSELQYDHDVGTASYGCNLGPGAWFVAFGGHTQLDHVDVVGEATCSCAVVINSNFETGANLWSDEVTCGPGQKAELLASGFVSGPCHIAWYFVTDYAAWGGGPAYVFITKFDRIIGD